MGIAIPKFLLCIPNGEIQTCGDPEMLVFARKHRPISVTYTCHSVEQLRATLRIWVQCAVISFRSLAVPHDLKIAVRHLLKSPGFSIMAVLMLAFGIGATTAIFSIVEGVLLRPLPFPNPNQLVVVADAIKGAEINGNDEAGVTAADIVNYTRDTQSFSALGGYQQYGNELSGVGEPAQINDARMTAGVFAALGVNPLIGRVFTTDEDTGNAP